MWRKWLNSRKQFLVSGFWFLVLAVRKLHEMKAAQTGNQKLETGNCLTGLSRTSFSTMRSRWAESGL